MTIPQKIVKNDLFGDLVYNEELTFYQCNIEVDETQFELIIDYCEPEKFDIIIKNAETLLNIIFLNKMLSEMAEEMIDLKNDNWLNEDEITGELEQEITIDEFRKQIYIESFYFKENFTATIYCNDNNLFWGHSININIDENGSYKNAHI